EDFASLRVKLAALRSENGEALGFLLTFDDLTELEKAQRLAAWREVARRIAHEVKNPLTPIQLSAGRLRRRFSRRLAGESDADIFEECTAVIIRQVEEMKKLVDEFSRFARLPEAKPRPGDFVQMLSESLALFRQAHKRVDFKLEVRRAPPVFSFDPEQMSRAMTNLLDNAIAAMNGAGRVRLILETDAVIGLRLSISDTGPGIDPAIRDRLFDPQVTTKSGGQGLGLAIVRTIISDHGGFVKARNNRDGGARFTIELPLRT
ncbi:MAG: PAS domain-containing sensor histidine kinase, partial [Candidatus Adiutrix sp.]|nr:PAS domain-containing sensor histidine kinase [Candidatus Adiutrix sp.]